MLAFPAGLALLIAQGVTKKDPAQTPQETDKLESIKDLDSSGPDGSGQDASDPETNLWIGEIYSFSVWNSDAWPLRRSYVRVEPTYTCTLTLMRYVLRKGPQLDYKEFS